ELVARAGEQVDPPVDLEAHAPADLLPVAQRRCTALRQAGKLLLDLRQSEPQPLRDEDEADAADIGPQESALIAAGAQRGQQTLFLIVAQRGDRDARTRGQLSNRNEGVGHLAPA